MSWLERIFGKAAASAGAEILLPTLVGRAVAEAAVLEHHEVEPALALARLADLSRAADRAPCRPAAMARLTEGFDAEAWRRLALLVSVTEGADLLPVLGALEPRLELGVAFAESAAEKPLLVMALLRTSELRAEELVRHLALRLRAPISGEDPSTSLRRAAELDYARLLDETEASKREAEERGEYLKKLMEQDRAQRRRGKW